MHGSRRLKLALILVVLAASGLALLAWTQTWVEADVVNVSQGSSQLHLDVAGSAAAPAVTALALAGLALAGALTIAGTIIRVILGVLEVLLGLSVFIAAFQAVNNPATASASEVTKATGIAGAKSTLVGVIDPQVTLWPYAALAAGVIMAIAGAGIVLTARRWPATASRYQTTRMVPADQQAADAGTGAGNDAVIDWDELSRGEDPTDQGPTADR